MAEVEVIEEKMLESHSGNCNGFVSRRETYVSSSLREAAPGTPSYYFYVINGRPSNHRPGLGTIGPDLTARSEIRKTHWVRYNANARRTNVMDRVTAQFRAHVV
jgi:hypothetical protein